MEILSSVNDRVRMPVNYVRPNWHETKMGHFVYFCTLLPNCQNRKLLRISYLSLFSLGKNIDTQGLWDANQTSVDVPGKQDKFIYYYWLMFTEEDASKRAKCQLFFPDTIYCRLKSTIGSTTYCKSLMIRLQHFIEITNSIRPSSVFYHVYFRSDRSSVFSNNSMFSR